jgi:hypothetical protein
MPKWILIGIVVALAAAVGCAKRPKILLGSTAQAQRYDVSEAKPIASPAAGAVSLPSAYERADRCGRRVLDILNSVGDDASARAAAPQLRSAAGELAAALKALKTTAALLDSSGRKQEVVDFYLKLAEKSSGEVPPTAQLPDAIERIALGPQGRSLRSEINTILDALLENSSATERERLQRRIQEKSLRG